MDMYKLKIHSAVDVITNSSTTIFSYFNGSVKPAKELINEIIKTFGGPELEGLTADDMFYFGTFCDVYRYVESVDDMYFEEDEHPYLGVPDDKWYEYTDSLIERITKGEIEKPLWMNRVEEHENYNGYHPENELYIVPKDEKFKPFADKMMKFVMSADHEAAYN